MFLDGASVVSRVSSPRVVFTGADQKILHRVLFIIHMALHVLKTCTLEYTQHRFAPSSKVSRSAPSSMAKGISAARAQLFEAEGRTGCRPPRSTDERGKEHGYLYSIAFFHPGKTRRHVLVHRFRGHNGAFEKPWATYELATQCDQRFGTESEHIECPLKHGFMCMLDYACTDCFSYRSC